MVLEPKSLMSLDRHYKRKLMTFPIKCLSLRQIQVLGQCEQCGFSQRTSTSQFSSFPIVLLKFRFPENVKEIWKNFLIFLTRQCQTNWISSSNFLAFLEYLHLSNNKIKRKITPTFVGLLRMIFDLLSLFFK